MTQAYTTAAIINFSFCPPQKPVNPSDFCANLARSEPKPTGRKFTEDEIVDWQTRVANLAAELKAGGGPMLDAIKKESQCLLPT